jgi:hypothetical protein
VVASPIPWVRASGSSPAAALGRIGSSTIHSRPWCGGRSATAGPLHRPFFLDQRSHSTALWWAHAHALWCLPYADLWRPTRAHVRRTDANLQCPTDAALRCASSTALRCVASAALRGTSGAALRGLICIALRCPGCRYLGCLPVVGIRWHHARLGSTCSCPVPGAVPADGLLHATAIGSC